MDLLARFYEPTAGRITLDGVDITKAATDRRARKGLAYVPQGREIIPHLTVRKTLQLGFWARAVKNGGATIVQRLLDGGGRPLEGGLLPDSERALRASLDAVDIVLRLPSDQRTISALDQLRIQTGLVDDRIDRHQFDLAAGIDRLDLQQAHATGSASPR